MALKVKIKEVVVTDLQCLQCACFSLVKYDDSGTIHRTPQGLCILEEPMGSDLIPSSLYFGGLAGRGISLKDIQ